MGATVTVYPNVNYSKRDDKGNQVYVNGVNPKETGMAVKTVVTYGESDNGYGSETDKKVREIRGYSDNDLEEKKKHDNHKMNEHFNTDISRKEIEDINNMLVRPEGWR